MEKRLLRPLRQALVAAAVLLLVVVAGLGVTVTRHRERLQMVRERVERTHRLEHFNLTLQEALLANDPASGLEPARIDALRREIHEVLDLELGRAPGSADRLRHIESILDQLETEPRAALAAALDVLQDVLVAERADLFNLLGELERTARIEYSITAGVVALALALAAWGSVALRRRIAEPLHDLGVLFSRLASGEFVRVEGRYEDALLGPLFRNFNFLVGRLEETDRLRHEYAERLERDVDRVTRALLDQHRTLARADRLAAVGELAAGLAHELRNPLAGVLMALTNLQSECETSEDAERLRQVRSELERMSRVLERLLDLARHTPEPRRRLHLGAVVDEVASFARHQLPRAVRLTVEVASDLDVTLPEDRFRQALLNLVLNASQAIGEDGGEIVVAAHRNGDGRVVVSVEDDGPGFGDEILAARGNSFMTGRSGGTGLGLALVRRFVRDLEGSLSLANREPHGARVVLELPAEVGG